jgi:hypothetical protein
MEVESNGTETEGVLVSDGTPQSGGFSPGETYDASNIEGRQMVRTENGSIRPINGQFSIGNVTRPDGTQVGENETIGYNNPDYETSNLTELKELNDQLNEQVAELNARQQRLMNSGGAGWLPDFGLNLGLGGIAPVLLLAGGAVLLLRN